MVPPFAMSGSGDFWGASSPLHAAAVSLAVLLPFPYYWLLWTYPSLWIKCCRGANPCQRMALVSTAMKLAQFLAVASVAHLTWPPWWASLLIAAGQALNLRVYQLLHEDGVYYGVRFGKDIPWVNEFPFGYLRDPQYTGSILSLLGGLYWIPWQYVALWCAGYGFMIAIESHEDPSTRAKKDD